MNRDISNIIEVIYSGGYVIWDGYNNTNLYIGHSIINLPSNITGLMIAYSVLIIDYRLQYRGRSRYIFNPSELPNLLNMSFLNNYGDDIDRLREVYREVCIEDLLV